MASVASEHDSVKGGAWLIEETDPATVMTPEQLTEEHGLIGQTAAEFIEQRGAAERRTAGDRRNGRSIGSWSRSAATLGLLGTNMPEEYGGVDLDKIATLDRLRAAVALRVVRHDLRRAGQPHDPADFHVRHRGAEAEVSAAASLRARSSAPTASANPARARMRSAPRPRAMKQAGRQLHPLRREDVDHQRRLRRRLHHLRQGRRRTLHRLHRRTGVAGRVERQGRAQARAARLVDDARHPAGREGAGRRRARRDRQGPQGRVQRAELRPLQAGRDVFRRRRSRDRGSREVRRDPQAVRHADRALRRHQAQARRDDRARVRARKHDVSHRRPDRRARPRQRTAPRRRHADAAGARGVRRRSVDRQGARQRERSTTSSTRTCRSTAATASSATTLPRATTATHASIASSRGPTRSTGCSSQAC